MYEVEFYEDENGYFDLLCEMGTRVGAPVTKYLEGDIWELRPLKHRFLYAYYEKGKFIVLHHFIKKSKKLPRRELEHARIKLKDWLERKKEK